MIKEFVCYDDYAELVDILTRQIESSSIFPQLKKVYGIRRGGLPIAVHLSHNLGLEFIQFAPLLEPEKILIVDDIADTGKTLEEYKRAAATATIYYKKRSIYKPTFYVKETNKWIVFPWETFNEEPNRPD